MTDQNSRSTKSQLLNKVNSYMEDCCFDVQGISTSQSLSSTAEAHLARILTKIVVGGASVWWSFLELKEFLKNKKVQKGF